MPEKKKKTTKSASHLRQSKSKDFLKRLQQENSMVEYFTRLTILNPPAARLLSPETETRREGGFVRLAHAKEEFRAPVITKGKSARKPTKNEK